MISNISKKPQLLNSIVFQIVILTFVNKDEIFKYIKNYVYISIHIKIVYYHFH